MRIRVKTLKTAERCAGRREASENGPWYTGGRYCAAVKRASMDLSRARAGGRRGGG
jgi:hypothetical protein